MTSFLSLSQVSRPQLPGEGEGEEEEGDDDEEGRRDGTPRRTARRQA